jgi:hypothetical protein
MLLVDPNSTWTWTKPLNRLVCFPFPPPLFLPPSLIGFCSTMAVDSRHRRRHSLQRSLCKIRNIPKDLDNIILPLVLNLYHIASISPSTADYAATNV